jgi:hypothetical protein
MRRGASAAFVVAALVAAVTGPAALDSAPRPDRGRIHVRDGVLAGVRMGDTAGEIERKLGPAAYGDGFFPRRSRRFTGPLFVPARDFIQAAVAQYADHAFLVGSIGAYSLKTVARGAFTERGVGIGDRLANARRAYPRAGCGRFSNGEGNAFRWCRARVGLNAVFFGGDPIASITVTRVGRLPRPLTRRIVDVRRGSYRGVSLGATRRQVVARLGAAPRWRGASDPALPLVRAIGGATPPFAAIRPLDVLRYPDVAYVLGRGRVYAIVVGGNAGGPRPRGVALMARHRQVLRLHPRLICRTQLRGETRVPLPVCAGRVGERRWLWVAGDPVANVVLATVALPLRAERS